MNNSKQPVVNSSEAGAADAATKVKDFSLVTIKKYNHRQSSPPLSSHYTIKQQ